ncbi:DKNYY domain-containing protein [Pedobacter cryoconitis]|uniref:DKNYY family protein n=1 Tax=Pedobacter cryoconitis TaxID=188932 RepID=A0A7X0MMM0_9SPHI|nr:DKNYY domain-containing protein [Pedobacter cryoconitis]MBB6502608.1 hypothetical protein [Pedobacter cryoconitis]
MKNYPFILVILLLTSCSHLGDLVDKEKSDSYFISSSGQLSYSQNGNWFELGSYKMDADPKTFKVLSTEIGEDKAFVFYLGIKQKEVDRNSFYMDKGIPKDKFSAYLLSDHLMKKIEGSDPKTFEYLAIDTLNHSWARDKNSYYLNVAKLKVDRNTFRFLNKQFSEDKDSVYANSEDGEFKSFLLNDGKMKTLNSKYIIDQKAIYYVETSPKIKVLSTPFNPLQKVRFMNEDVLCGDDQVIFYGKAFKYKTVDVNSFQLYFPKDKFSLYAKDKNNVYYDGDIVAQAEVNTYVPLKFGFGKDAKNVYYKTNLLKGVDSKSFKEIETNGAVNGKKYTAVFGDKSGHRFDWDGNKI